MVLELTVALVRPAQCAPSHRISQCAETYDANGATLAIPDESLCGPGGSSGDCSDPAGFAAVERDAGKVNVLLLHINGVAMRHHRAQ